MKRVIVLIIVCIIRFNTAMCYAEQGSITNAAIGDQMKNTIWGYSTNGMRLGLQLTNFRMSSTGEMPYCIVYIQNVSTQTMYYAIDKVTKNIRLYHGNIEQKHSKNVSLNITRLRPHAILANGVAQESGFVLSEHFNLRTNGEYQLSVSLCCSTNCFSIKPTFFDLFATNKFNYERKNGKGVNP